MKSFNHQQITMKSDEIPLNHHEISHWISVNRLWHQMKNPPKIWDPQNPSPELWGSRRTNSPPETPSTRWGRWEFPHRSWCRNCGCVPAELWLEISYDCHLIRVKLMSRNKCMLIFVNLHNCPLILISKIRFESPNNPAALTFRSSKSLDSPRMLWGCHILRNLWRWITPIRCKEDVVCSALLIWRVCSSTWPSWTPWFT